MTKTLTDLTNAEFDHLIERHIEQMAQWDGTLPLDTLLQTWAEIERRKPPLLVRVRLIAGQIVLETPPESPLSVRDAHTLILEDGNELTLEFEDALLAAAHA